MIPLALFTISNGEEFKPMVPDERIRQLCARVVTGRGAEFQAALMELKEAIDSRLAAEKQQATKRSGSRSEQA